MSKRIKVRRGAVAKPLVTSRMSTGDIKLRRLAQQIPNEQVLNHFLAQVKPGMRDACRERMRRLVTFELTIPPLAE